MDCEDVEDMEDSGEDGGVSGCEEGGCCCCSEEDDDDGGDVVSEVEEARAKVAGLPLDEGGEAAGIWGSGGGGWRFRLG